MCTGVPGMAWGILYTARVNGSSDLWGAWGYQVPRLPSYPRLVLPSTQYPGYPFSLDWGYPGIPPTLKWGYPYPCMPSLNSYAKLELLRLSFYSYLRLELPTLSSNFLPDATLLPWTA